jgi:phosphate transport system protein
MAETTRLRLQRKIDKLKTLILALGAHVKENVTLSVKAIKLRDAELAKKVIRSDPEIDRMEIELEEECLEVLALHQPVATDLRFIIGILKVNQELERVGDMAVNIARTAVDLAAEKPLHIPDDYFSMADEALSMLNKSLDALVNMNTEAAYAVLAADDHVDLQKHKLHRDFEDRLREEMDHRSALTHLFLVSRHLERIADHTTNIAEDVIYMVTGEILRHQTG